MEPVKIFTLSDSVGDTCEALIQAALCHFDFHSYEMKKISFVQEVSELESILNEAKEGKSIVFYTLMNEEHVKYIQEFSKKENIQCIDLLTDTITAFQKVFQIEPKKEVGMLRKLNNSYFNRIESLEFAVKYDDGKDVRGLIEADIILLGISRTGKTPLSLYLANKNYRVLNLPLIPTSPIPKELFEVPREKIFVLTISHDKVKAIREERLKSLGFGLSSKYSNSENIFEEILFCEELTKKLGCRSIDITNRAIEETGDVILKYLEK